MKLKSIKLVGFKSFVEPTVLPIKCQMNAIVGPNGCGKSNIIDAVRWVVGETSAKQLRGQSMSDVIFNGSTNRKPLGKAAVELVFDNSDGSLGGEYASYAEISVRREVEREGQSSYFLNGTSCRRKDVLNVFLGTGLGPRSYSIIEQGMVSRLIEAKPEDLRVYIEEAAGISKYKERRRETENRIRHTKENMDRVNDLCDEIAKQLAHLRRQATSAERYKEYRAEERLLSGQLKAIQWLDLQAELEKIEGRIQELTNEKEAQTSQQRHVEVELEETRVALQSSTDTFNEVQKRFYGQGAEIARLEQRIKNIQEQQQQWELELDQASTLWTEINDSIQDQQIQAGELESEVAELAPQRETAAGERDQAVTALQTAETNMQQWQQRWDEFQQVMSQSAQMAEVSKTKISHYQEQIASLSRREQELQQLQSEQQVGELTASVQPLILQSDQLSNTVERLQAQLAEQKTELDNRTEQRRQAQQALQQGQNELAKMQGQAESLQALQEAALSSNLDEQNDWLERYQLTTKPRLAQQLKVNQGWEAALELVLANTLNAVCVDDARDLLGSVQELAQAHVTLIERSNETNTSTRFTPLASKVTSNWPIDGLLAGMYAADSLQQALSWRSELQPHESIVTQDGLWIGKHWARVARGASQEDNVLVRQQELENLQQAIVTQQESLIQLQAQFDHHQEEVAKLEQQREQDQQSLQQVQQESAQVRSELATQQTRLDEFTAQQERLVNELSQCQQTLERTRSELVQAESDQQQSSSLQSEQAGQRDQLLAERDSTRQVLENAREHAQTKRQLADQIEIRLAANENQLALLKQTLERDERQLAQLDAKKTALNESLEGRDDADAENLHEQLQGLLEQRVATEQELKQAETEVGNNNHKISELEENRNTLVNVISNMGQRMQEIQVDRQTFVVNQRNIQEYIDEKDMNLESIIQKLPEERNAQEWQQNIEKYQTKIQRLGPINLAAIDECKTLEERKEYLDAQQADLVEALEILEGAISKIDKETRQRFKETYESVNEKFKKNFPKIFGGGRAELELLENDLLTTGLTVRAQPPGKRNSTIHMLSGGEKALTAIALVFSLFELNPAPFCILDEVDAPLDDANVGRYAALVKAMSETTQFLVISHNKVTIEQADELLGVTMHEPGVSRIVSVDMKEAVEMSAV